MSDAKFIPGLGAIRQYEEPPVAKSEPSRPRVPEYPQEYVSDQFGTMVRPVQKTVAKKEKPGTGGKPKNLVEAVVDQVKADMDASEVKESEGYAPDALKETDAEAVVEDKERVEELTTSDEPVGIALEAGKKRKTLKNEDKDRMDLKNKDDDLLVLNKEMKSDSAGTEEEEEEEYAEEEVAEKSSVGVGSLVYLPEYGHRASVVALKANKSKTGSRILVVKGAGKVFEVEENSAMPA